MLDLDKVEVSDIVYFLRNYDKKSLAADNAIEHRAYNVQSVINEKEEALLELEEAINKYIDSRIEYVLKHTGDEK